MWKTSTQWLLCAGYSVRGWRQANIGFTFKGAYSLIGYMYRVMVFNYNTKQKVISDLKFSQSSLRIQKKKQGHPKARIKRCCWSSYPLS